MLKVFLVEDESVIREGFRENIPWQQCGYTLVGEASDGEMALPLIRKLRPDVLLTDIKMPFMDGLSLSKIVSEEMPSVKIIILSGHDDFEYAREAISVGVEQYLLKPITRSALQKVLLETRDKIESERSQNNYTQQYQDDLHEYEQFSRRYFFEKVLAGNLSVQEIYEESKKLSIELDAASYNLILMEIRENTEVQENLLRFFLRFSEYIVFRWNINIYAILVKGDAEQSDAYTQRGLSKIRQTCEAYSEELEWYAAAGNSVNRLSLLPDCYQKANHIFSYRFVFPKEHILTEETIRVMQPEREVMNYENLDLSIIDPEIIRSFLLKGSVDEVSEFAETYLLRLKDALRSAIFRNYLILNIRFTVLSYIDSLGIPQNEFLEKCGLLTAAESSMGPDEMTAYMQNIMKTAIELRDMQSNRQGKRILKKVADYIEENYMNDSLSLNEVAGVLNVSANYFSAMFSNEMNMTFVEYVTNCRMDHAKKLLRETDYHTGDIALLVGYKDPHYFSFVFKKTQGCTPREYRNSL